MLSLLFFIIAIHVDVIIEDIRRGIQWELLYEDDCETITYTKEKQKDRWTTWQKHLEKLGLKANSRKTKVMMSSRSKIEDVGVKDNRRERLEQVATFRYLMSVTEENGGCKADVRSRIKDGW